MDTKPAKYKLNEDAVKRLQRTEAEEEFEAMLAEAKMVYTNIPDVLLRVALQASLQEEKAHKDKKLPKKMHLIEKDIPIEDKYKREVPETMEYKGIEVFPETETTLTEIVEQEELKLDE